MARGVNAREMIWRSLVWSGASWLISRNLVFSTPSRSMSGPNRMITPSRLVEKLAWSLEIAATSACLLTAQ